jgi:hypothetical protein
MNVAVEFQKKLNKHGIEFGWFSDLEFQATNVRN